MKRVAIPVVFALCFATAPASADGGGVHGYVDDWMREKTVGGATVRISGPAGVLEAESDARGFFSFLGLLPGRYFVIAKKPGYFSGCPQALIIEPDEMKGVRVKIDAKALLYNCGYVGFESLFDPNATADVYDIH